MKEVKTFRDALEESVTAFMRANISEPHLSAKYLLTRAGGEKLNGATSNMLDSVSAGFGNNIRALLQNIDEPFINVGSKERFLDMCEKRLRHMPVQYILGDWDFRQLCLQLRPPVLIPRPETEELVGLVLGEIANFKSRKNKSYVLDVGCGSGAIGLALLSELDEQWHVDAIDISEEAVSLALENAELHQLSSRYRCMLADVHTFHSPVLYDLIVSNPPYIPNHERAFMEPDVLLYEDHRALFGGGDGLDIIRTILKRGPELMDLRNGLRQIWVELSPSHAQMIPEMDIKGLEAETIFTDIAGRDRFCKFAVHSPRCPR